jgi:hypothetical protein
LRAEEDRKDPTGGAADRAGLPSGSNEKPVKRLVEGVLTVKSHLYRELQRVAVGNRWDLGTGAEESHC